MKAFSTNCTHVTLSDHIGQMKRIYQNQCNKCIKVMHMQWGGYEGSSPCPFPNNLEVPLSTLTNLVS
ncbi:hypothetical protein EXN66_Car018202 [Channa argus]|uniref:Uncharacterized protein n=1 Tax=Channa argus TaxID=215402 RepID=A0A6G1QJ78_CHAAH|nr:hypothetical protein EXN66_Car018202 [Channa argus]